MTRNITFSGALEKLKPCPCGKTPEYLMYNYEYDRSKWAHCAGACCCEWWVEFRTNYVSHKDYPKEFEDLAIEAWNDAPRRNSPNKLSISENYKLL